MSYIPGLPPPAGAPYGYPPPPESYAYGAPPPMYPPRPEDTYRMAPPPVSSADSYRAPPAVSYPPPPGPGYPPPHESYPPHGSYPPPPGAYGAPPPGPPVAPGYPPAYPPTYGYGPAMGPGYGPPPPGPPSHARVPSPRRDRDRERSPRRRQDNKRGQKGDKGGGRDGDRRGHQGNNHNSGHNNSNNNNNNSNNSSSNNHRGRRGGKDNASNVVGGQRIGMDQHNNSNNNSNQQQRDHQNQRNSSNQNPNDPRTRGLLSLLQSRRQWSCVWLEGIDPPRRAATTPNVSMLLLHNPRLKTPEGSEDAGFMLAHNRVALRKKDRERECTKDVMMQCESLQLDDPKAWCHIPSPGNKTQATPDDLDRIRTAVDSRCARMVVEFPEPMACVVVATCAFSDRPSNAEPDLGLLERLDPGFVEQFREARRVSGLVKKQWYLATVNVRREGSSNTFALGVGLGTDRESSRARAIHAAEVRAALFTEAVATKLCGPDTAAPATATEPAAEPGAAHTEGAPAAATS